MTAKVTIGYTVPAGYSPGDYARLFGNVGAGSIDYDTPLSEKLDLFPNGSGIYGFGHAPWGKFPWGHAFSLSSTGWGHQPWGTFPWGYGSAQIKNIQAVTECGAYKYAFGAFDRPGNAHTGSPEEIELHIHTAPQTPTKLTKGTYDKATDVLILNAA